MDAALNLFAHQGYAATTVRQIAGAVGVTDAAIYSHFASKREIFDALLEMAGPSLLDRLHFDPQTVASQHPGDVLPDLVAELVAAWDTPKVRLFTSVLMREARPDIAVAIAKAQSALGIAVAKWQQQGVLRNDVAADVLTWELVTPLAALRLSLLHAESTDDERAAARKTARRHIDYFLSTALGKDLR